MCCSVAFGCFGNHLATNFMRNQNDKATEELFLKQGIYKPLHIETERNISEWTNSNESSKDVDSLLLDKSIKGGRFKTADGQLVNANGDFIDEAGNVVAKRFHKWLYPEVKNQGGRKQGSTKISAENFIEIAIKIYREQFNYKGEHFGGGELAAEMDISRSTFQRYLRKSGWKISDIRDEAMKK